MENLPLSSSLAASADDSLLVKLRYGVELRPSPSPWQIVSRPSSFVLAGSGVARGVSRRMTSSVFA